MNSMVRKCKRFLMLALTALLVCNEIVVVEASGSGQVAVVEEVQQEDATEVSSLEKTDEGEGTEEVITEAQGEDEAEEITQSETKTEDVTVDEDEFETKAEELTEDADKSETKTEAVTEDESETETTTEEETTEEMTTEELKEIKEVRTALAMAIDESENSKTYAAADLEEGVVWGAETTKNEDGSVLFSFPKQYAQLTLMLPEDIDKERLSKIICNTQDDASYLSLKIFRDEDISKDGAEAQVVYGNSKIEISDELTADDIKCFGIMGLKEIAEGDAPYEVVIDSITFEYADKKTASDTQKVEDKTYSFKDLEKKANWNVEIADNDDNSTLFQFTKQYGAVSYKIPEDIDKSKIDKIVCKTDSSAGLSLKFFGDEEMQNETAVTYNNNELSADGLSVEDLNCIGLMGLTDGGCEFNIESVTFVMKKEEAQKPQITIKPFYKSANDNNPIVTQRYSADPGVMVYDDTVYVYTTNDVYEYKNGELVENTYATINTLNCFSSKDMVNWTDHGVIQVAGKDGAAKWAKNSWAPAAAHKKINGKDKFFLYFADNGGGIGVLTSDSPTGPWVDPLGHGFITRNTPNCSNVDWLFDPAVFVDDDGTGYLYFGGGGVEKNPANPKTARVVKLGDDMISLANDPVMIDAPYLFEDSGINKIGDKYYYSYCSNWNTSGSKYSTAAIEYMVSDDPMGPFTYAGEMFKNPGVTFGVWGNNHHSMFEFRGKYYLAYHARALETGKLGTNLGYRSTQIDEIKVEDGKILLETPTMTGVAQLSKVDPYETVQAETIARELNIEVIGCGDTYVKGEKDEWTCVKGVDFKYGVSDITVSVKADRATTMEIRTGSTTGTLIGTVKIDNTNGAFKELTTEVQNVSGVKNLFFVYKGDVQFDYWKANTANIFTFDQLEVVAEHSLTKEVTANGALKVSYEKQWGEVRFAIPESVDVTRLNKLVVNMKSGDVKALSLKLLSDYSFDTQDNLLAAAYEASELSTGEVANREDMKYFGLMSKAEDAVEFEFESIEFEMDADPADADESGSGIQRDVPDLKDAIAAKTDSEFITGVSITNGEISDQDLMDLVTKHFNAVTLGNELKPDCLFGYSNNTCPGTEIVTFNGVEMEVPKMDYSRPEKMLDAILKWNKNNPDDIIKVRGHVLVWHSQTPEWFFCKDYDTSKGYVDKDTMTLRQEWFIKTVLEHFTGEDSKYKGMFYGWDVVNEAVSDGRGTYRNGNENSTWWKVYESNEFIINAFRFANKYAPADVELYYNDYNEWVTSKVGGIVQLLKDVKNAEGTRIDGMGMQGHYSTDASPSVEQIKEAARAYAEVVDKIQITELDLKASNAYDGTEATQDAEYTKQAYRYKDVYDTILELRKEGVNLSNMTIWGVIDKNSWLQTSNSVGGASDGKKRQCPLLFDDNYQVKPAYWAFVDITKLEPEIKNFDISQVVDDAFTATTSLEVNAGSAQMTAIPVWDKDGIHVLAKVKDSTVEDTDAVTVYVSVDGKITKSVAARKDGTATKDGYEVVVDVACDESVLYVPAEILMDVVLTDGATKNAYNDYTMKQETSDQYYAKASLKPYILIPKATVTVDGTKEAAWDQAVEVPLTINLGSKVKANAKLVWDEENLYVYMDVTDSVLNSENANAHEKDSIEVFIDENNHKSTAYEEDDKQYRINYLDEHSFNGTKCLEENMKSKVTLTDKGYTVEAAFAWTDVEPTADMKIGLELQINDADASGKRIGTLSWYDTSGNGWSEPGVFGTAILADGDKNNDTPAEPEDKPNTPITPEKPADKPSTGGSSSQNNSSKTTTTVTKLHTIVDSKAPLASGIIEESDTSVSIAFSEKKALLRQALLSKYYGKVHTLMAHLGNGIGFTMDANVTGGKDVDLSATLQVVEKFAEGFDSFKMNTQQSTTLNGEIGIHVNVGVQYVGLQAYIFQKNMVTGLYELKNTMPVNAVGNVAVMTNAIADMYILIAK